MRIADLIQKKKKGKALNKDEIDYIIKGYTNGEIPDYQISAFLMAVYFRGMTKEETADFTLACVNSGERIDLSEINGIKVDKHSTGGVGDKISLIVIPLVASVGVPVAKMSGRGLGHTGGTIDKLESIPGFKTAMTREEFINNVNTYKMAIVGSSADLAPADKKLYALRDVTATIDSIPLIASSIMSKKIASGADAIVLDVKVGSGAFMKSIDEAKILAREMVDIGKSLNKKTVAIITDMNEPLGFEVGNANEIREVIDVLSGKGSNDETEVALTIASYMTILGGVFEDYETAYNNLNQMIHSGRAIENLKVLIQIQGGNPDVIVNPELLPSAKNNIRVKSSGRGYITEIDAEKIGLSAMLLGAGRRTKEDIIDFAAGITMLKKVGDPVDFGEEICILHTNLMSHTEAEDVAVSAFKVSPEKPHSKKFIYEVIT